MSELEELRRENEILLRQNGELLERATYAEQALHALAHGEIDAVRVQGSATPVLLLAAQEELRRSEGRYRQLIEELPEPILLHIDRHIAYANAAAAQALGVGSPTDLVGRSILDFASPATRARIEARMAEDGSDEGPALSEQSFLRPNDGREVFAEVKSIPIVYQGRAAMLSIARDITQRVEAECAVAAALFDADLGRRKLEAVLESLPVGVMIADAAGAIIQTNPALVRIWGGHAPKVARPSEYGVYEAFWPKTGQPLVAEEWALARTLANGETIVAEELEIVRFDGTRGHVLSSSAPILDEHGQRLGGVVVLLDVEQAHVAERERERLITSLEHERRRLGTLLAKAPAFIATLRGKDYVFELANEAYDALTGHRALIGKALLSAIPEFAGQGIVDLLDGVLETGKPYVAHGRPVRLVTRQGSPPERRFVDFVCQPVVEADGRRSGIFIHGIDVTDAVIAQQRLRAQFNGVPVPTYVWQRTEHAGKARFVLVDFNEAALTISHGGISRHRGESAETYFENDPAVAEELERCFAEGTKLQREMDRTLRSTGETRRLFVTYAAAPPDLVIVHTEDITDRVKLEEQFRQAQKMEAVGRLAGGVAHDFNNLLTIILSLTDLNIMDLKAGDPLRSDLEEIQAAGLRASSLTRQLLAFSRQQVLQPQVIDVGAIVSGLTSMLQRLLGEDVILSVSTALGVGHVLADPGQVEQVLTNLAVNARDAMPQGGTLAIELANVVLDGSPAAEVSSAAAGPYVMLAIRDSGTGMSAATRARIFEPFFTTKRRGKELASASPPSLVSSSRVADTSAWTVSSGEERRSRCTYRRPTARPRLRARQRLRQGDVGSRPSCSSKTRSRSVWSRAPSCAVTDTMFSMRRTAARPTSSRRTTPVRSRSC